MASAGQSSTCREYQPRRDNSPQCQSPPSARRNSAEHGASAPFAQNSEINYSYTLSRTIGTEKQPARRNTAASWRDFDAPRVYRTTMQFKALSLLRTVILFGSIATVASACSSTPTVEEFCGGMESRYDACPPKASTSPRPAFERTFCTEAHKCFSSLYTSSFVNAYAECLSNKDCSADVDNCGSNLVRTGPNTVEAEACEKKHAECGDTNSFDDDYCSAVRILNADTLSELMPCFGRPCDQVTACARATVRSIAGEGCDID